MRRFGSIFVLIFATAFSAGVAGATGTSIPAGEEATAPKLPPELDAVKFEQRMGSQLPLDAAFVNDNGEAVTLADYFGERPVALAMVYYECPMLCQLTLSGIATGFGPVDFDAGQDFDVLVISIDEGETPEMAKVAKEVALKRYDREGAGAGWHFLTGGAEEIARVAEAVGFNYRYDPETDQYAHASGIVLMTPEGKTSRYFFGIEYAPRDLRLGLVEASENKIGSVIDQVLLFCLHYDPATGKYSTEILGLTRVAGILTVLILFISVIVMLRREKSKPAHGTLGTA